MKIGMFSQESSTPLPSHPARGKASGVISFLPLGSELFCENIQQSSFSMFSHSGEKEHAFN